MTGSQIEDVRYLRETMGWPNWPHCPVKRWNEAYQRMDCATCYDAPEGRRVVYHVNMHIAIDQRIDLNTVPKTAYPNSVSMVLDGWEVD